MKILSCLFGGSETFKFEFAFEDFIGSSVPLRARSAQRLSSQHFAAVQTPNIAKLESSVFSVHNHGFCGDSQWGHEFIYLFIYLRAWLNLYIIFV